MRSQVYRIGGRVDTHVGERTREGFDRGEVGFPVGWGLACSICECGLYFEALPVGICSGKRCCEGKGVDCCLHYEKLEIE